MTVVTHTIYTFGSLKELIEIPVSECSKSHMYINRDINQIKSKFYYAHNTNGLEYPEKTEQNFPLLISFFVHSCDN